MSSTSDVIARQKAIAIIPKFSAFFSALGSGFIIYDIVCSHYNISPDFWCRRKKTDEFSTTGFSNRSSSLASARGRSSRRFAQRKTLQNSAYYRLMLAMSTSDFIVSSAWFFTTWPIPKDENSLDNPSEFVYGNIGNQQTCNAQAFFIQLGIITPFYNALLACYYYLTIGREWKEEDFKRKIEYAGHIVSISFGFGTSIAGLFMGIFNNSSVWCWISPYPYECGDGPEQTPCVRGANSEILRWIFYYAPLWVMIFLVAFFMTLVYMYVRGLDNKMDEYTTSYFQNAETGGQNGGGRSLMARTFSTMNAETLHEQRRQRRNVRSKAVANQGLFYAGTFALVWVCGTIVRAMQLAGATPTWNLNFWFAVLTPAQGFFNFLVYIRPKLVTYLERRKKQRNSSRSNRSNFLNARAANNSFDSDILHVSGVSSSNQVIDGNQNQDTSSQSSDVALNESSIGLAEVKVLFKSSTKNLETKEPEELPEGMNIDTKEKRDYEEMSNSDDAIATVNVTLDNEEDVGIPDTEIKRTESE